MKTKFLMILAFVAMIGSATYAQDKKQPLTPEQKIEKRVGMMQKKLMLDDATAAKFAPIYKEYLQAKIAARPTCKREKNPTDAQIKENMEKCFDAQQKSLDVEKKYFKKLSSVLSGRQLQVVFGKGDKKAAFEKGSKRAFKGKMHGGKKAPHCGRDAKCCDKAAPLCPKTAQAPAAPVK